ncbi:flavodoxin [Clostridium sp. WILCCON 0269]|uniref:Flavodoxin n=1 Tax=Candidatus Clostridium eludens TaxID=3381663 RepID=A0ABW8SSL0_9CLOT
MKKLYFVNGSPKVNNSVSEALIDNLYAMILNDNIEVNRASLNNRVNYEDITNSDILVIASPLYVDLLPSTVIEFLMNLEQQTKNMKKLIRVYAVVNCGFFEGIQNRHALRILENFCTKVGYEWRFGVGVGAGEFMKNTKSIIPFNSEIKKDAYNAFMEIKKDIDNDFKYNKENIFTSPRISKDIFISNGNVYWIEAAERMSISKEQLYAKTLLENV